MRCNRLCFVILAVALTVPAILVPPARAEIGLGANGAPATAAKGWLGVEVKPYTREDPVNPEKRLAAGVQVIRTADGSPAASLLTGGDVITSVDGKAVTTSKAFFAAIGAKQPDASVKLGITRGGKRQTVTMTVGMRPEDRAAAQAAAPATEPPAAEAAPAPTATPETPPPAPAATPEAPAPAATQTAAEPPAAVESNAPPAQPALPAEQAKLEKIAPHKLSSARPGDCDGIVVDSGQPGQTEQYCVKPGSGKAHDHVFQDCPNCPEMVVIPAGSFMMGSPQSEAADSDGRHSERESPQHKVSFTRAFAVGRFAVTFDEWNACLADGGCGTEKTDDMGWGHGRRPVINVSWGDARAYVKWLSQKTGKPYRLLSEGEREYVTRAGTTTPYWWGDSIKTTQANIGADSTNGETHKYMGEPGGKFRNQTLPVDSFQPNPWGLYQVHGNVWEWTEDCYTDNYKTKPEAMKANGGAQTVGDCFYHVMRGGAWDNQRFSSRAAARSYGDFDRRSAEVGFRVAREVAR